MSEETIQGLNHKSTDPVSIQEIALNSYSYQVWPNPATDVLHLQLLDNSDNQGYTYQLLSLAGKLLQGGRLSDNTEIDVRSLVSGIYFLRIENSLHQTQTVKFIKK